MTRKLAELTESCSISATVPDIDVTGVAYDSRAVTHGDIFVAVDGFHVDGADYAKSAVGNGAVAVVAGRDVAGLPPGVPVIVVTNPRLALARLAAELAGHPSRQLTVVGITGTDGKTTTS